ncbi:MAG: peptide chain release factor-like protein, partial [Raoultibacter sp.]
TDSAVRLTHIPTGLVVTCQNEKSQLQNKEAAFRVLRGKLYELEARRREEELNELRGSKMENSFGSQIRNYVLYPYQMVKDVRSGHETGNVDAVLDGEIEEFVLGYHRWKAAL